MPAHDFPARDLRLRGLRRSPGETGLMAIINRTPDSFHDAGTATPALARRALA